MFEAMFFIAGIGVGVWVASVLRKSALASRLKETGEALSATAIKLSVTEEQKRSLTEQKDQIQKANDSLVAIRLDLEKQISAVTSENKGLQVRIMELSKIREDLTVNMETIMRKVHEASHDRASKTSQEKLDAVIAPFKSQLETFGQAVRDTYDKGSKETLTLKNEILTFSNLQQGLLHQTESLTRALKGDSKVQGDWGEMILESLLESAGLREGHEFSVQGKDLDLRDENGTIRRPDVVVHLPREKDVIIDSKVSLNSYEEFCRAATEDERTIAAKALVGSIESHIKDLTKKDYASLYGVNTPDYVFMFIPIDGAYMLALQAAPNLYQKALEGRVHLVSPSLLMPGLRLIHHLWQGDKQSKNAIEIAEQAGRLYDKFVDFVADVHAVQTAIGKAGDVADAAMKKLHSGTGNLVSRTEKIKLLGAKAKKQLSTEKEISEGNEKEKKPAIPGLMTSVEGEQSTSRAGARK